MGDTSPAWRGRPRPLHTTCAEERAGLMMIDLHPCTAIENPADTHRSMGPIGCAAGFAAAPLDPAPLDPARLDANWVDAARFGADRLPTAEQQLRVGARHPRSGICIVIASGEIDLFTTPLLEAALWTQLATVPAHLIVDLTDVRFMAACGVRCLLETRDIAARSGRTQLHLAGLHHRHVARLLQLTAATELFDTHLTLTGALAAIATKPSSASRR